MEELIPPEGDLLLQKTWTDGHSIFFLTLQNLLAGPSASTSISSFQTSSCEVSVEPKRKNIPSVSTALLLGGVLGLLETLLLVLSAKPILGYMGVKPVIIYLFLLVY
jgi:hypothetical protein